MLRAMATVFSLRTGFSPALAVDDDVSHTGIIVVNIAFAMFLILGSAGIRGYSAYSRRVLQVDDWTFVGTVGWLDASGQSEMDWADELMRIPPDSCTGSGIGGVPRCLSRMGKDSLPH